MLKLVRSENEVHASLLAKIIIISVAGSFMCLDRIFIQAMISRPIVIAPVTGLILGEPRTGLMIGALLVLFWMDRVPIGIHSPKRFNRRRVRHVTGHTRRRDSRAGGPPDDRAGCADRDTFRCCNKADGRKNHRPTTACRTRRSRTQKN